MRAVGHNHLACDVMPADAYETAHQWDSKHLRISPPPPAEYHTRDPTLDQRQGGWRGRDWSAAWRDAQDRTALDRRLYKAVPHWTKLLGGDPEMSDYWAEGRVPEPQPVLGGGDHGRVERLACRGHPGMRTPMAKSQPDCESWWPANPTADGRPCVAYVVGIGDLKAGGRGDAWSFRPRRDLFAREGSAEKWLQQESGYYFAEATLQDAAFMGGGSGGGGGVTYTFYYDASEPINSDDPRRNVNPEVIRCSFDDHE